MDDDDLDGFDWGAWARQGTHRGPRVINSVGPGAPGHYIRRGGRVVPAGQPVPRTEFKDKQRQPVRSHLPEGDRERLLDAPEFCAHVIRNKSAYSDG